MKSLFEYEFLVNEVFYRSQPIMHWIEKHHDMSELDKDAIKATIMDALVYKKLIDPKKESLNFEQLSIANNLDYYVYEECPNICGIPQWMKEEFRKKSLKITAGIPISIFLSKPSSKHTRYCVYDPNVAVSSIFSDATFYETIYNSPTRNIRIPESRPFVEININNEQYLVDVLTKRIIKTSFFKENYALEIQREKKISEYDQERKDYYDEMVSENVNLSVLLPTLLMFENINQAELAEMKYELTKSKEYFSEEWKKYEAEQVKFEKYLKRFPR